MLKSIFYVASDDDDDDNHHELISGEPGGCVKVLARRGCRRYCRCLEESLLTVFEER